MKMKNYVKALSLGVCLFSGGIHADTNNGKGSINYSWLNAIVNKTPVVSAACPEINTDIYGSGFRVALSKSFFGMLSESGSRWFPHNQQWASVGIGPLKNNFGIFFSDINNLSELSEEKEKHTPESYNEINKWKVNDSAYWESQGGVGLYLGTGISPVDIGVFVVASGGWVHFVQKTGPTRVYVELQKKKIKSISLGGGVGVPNVSIGKSFEKSNGFSYEFILDNQDAIEAYERFMAGDMTKAQELSKFKDSGVNKISDLSDDRVGVSKGFGMSTPLLPIITFKISSETAYDHAEENSVWDEDIMKDTGIYIKQRNMNIANQQFKEARSFVGGKITNNSPGPKGEVHTESLYGNFKYSYQSNWGQERRLRKYIARAKALTGLTNETCARVPSFEDSLGFNQVNLEMNWSDSYLKEIVGINRTKTSMLPKIRNLALHFQLNEEKNNSDLCDYPDKDNGDDDTCSTSSPELIKDIFSNLESYIVQMNKNYNSDKKEFAKYLSKFGKEVWRSPYVFKAFYEKGKVCGQDFKFEVSGQRLTRHAIDQKFVNTKDCLN